MDHGGNVWRGDGPEGWLDFSASLRPEGREFDSQEKTEGLKDAK